MPFVSFTDETRTVINAIFGAVQDLEYFPYQDELADDDPRVILFWNPPVDVVAINTAQQTELSTAASLAMTPLFMSLQLGDATDEETVKAKAWQTYYRALQAVDLTAATPEWPAPPEI